MTTIKDYGDREGSDDVTYDTDYTDTTINEITSMETEASDFPDVSTMITICNDCYLKIRLVIFFDVLVILIMNINWCFEKKPYGSIFNKDIFAK